MQILTTIFYRPSFLVIFSILFLLFEVSAPGVLISLFGSFDPQRILIICALLIYTYIWFFFIPSLTQRYVFNESLPAIGLRMPSRRWSTLAYVSIALLLLIPWITYFAHRPEFKAYVHGHPSLVIFIVTQLFTCPIYYFAEEFFFRGFLFLNLWEKVGWHSFWITDIFFTLSHIGKPGLEILMCIPASVIFNFLTLKTRSIMPAVFVHTTLGILLNFLVTFRV